MSPSLEFWFEFASTYSYPAAMRVEAVAQRAGVSVVWRPFLLGPIFAEQGWNDSPFNLYPAKGRYMWRDLERICAAQGIAFRRPSAFPRSGLRAARIACHHADAPWVPDFVRAVYRANFAEDRDVADPVVLRDLLASIGEDRSRLEAASAPEAKGALRTQTERAAALGIFGAPTIAIGEELFWGNDRVEQAVEWCARAELP